jgi:integrase
MGYVLHIDGRPIGNIKKGFAAACRRAGIEDATPHTLRHTAATWIMQSGKVPTWEAAAFLGMTEKTLVAVYGHHSPDYMRAAADAISFRRISA